MKHKPFHYLLLSLVLLSTAPAAFAQYIWLNEKGSKQYSDMPPPASVPQSRILKEPGKPLRPTGEAASGEAAQGDKAETEKAPPTLAEKNAEFQKRRAEQAEKEKKEADAANFAKEKAKNCERAREYLRILESGQRIANTNKNGERNFLSDEQRSKEIREANKILSECK